MDNNGDSTLVMDYMKSPIELLAVSLILLIKPLVH